VLVITASLSASADDAPVVPTQGGTIVPYHEEFIELVSEEIDIYLGRIDYRVEVEYRFTNTGPETGITMGFPNESDWMYGVSIPDFRAWVDGEEQEIYRKISRESDKPWGSESAPDYYFECFDTVFAAGATRVIENRYSQRYMINYDMTEETAKYILSTGAYWRGRIDTVTVRVHFERKPEELAPRKLTFHPDEGDSPYYFGGISIDPRPTGAIDDGMEIVLTDLEPDFDIEITMPPPVVRWVTSNSELMDTRFSYAPENVLDNDPTTSWVEGDEGAGIGSTLRLELSSSIGGGKLEGVYEIAAVGMINGYAANSELYSANNRVKRAVLDLYSIIDSSRPYHEVIWDLDETMEMQYYRFPEPVRMSELSITIEDVYAGTRYDDTCIAEIVVIPVEANGR